MEWVVTYLVYLWGCLGLLAVFLVLDNRDHSGWKVWLKWPAFVGSMFFLYGCILTTARFLGVPI